MSMDNGLDSFKNSNSVMYIIPQEKETREDLLNVDTTTKVSVLRLHSWRVSQNWQNNTIANSVIENLIRALSAEVKITRNGQASINFYNLIEAYVTVKKDENAEKEGNINIAFRIKDRVTSIITDDTPRDQIQYTFISPEAKFEQGADPEYIKKMRMLDQSARNELNNKYGIVLTHPWMAIAIADVFLENLFRRLTEKSVLTQKPAVSINFNDNIEFHAIRKADKLTITMRPGMNAKLLIKSDEVTEADYDDDL